jgi:glycosyltransferase involved in cell wall biosynthesis
MTDLQRVSVVLPSLDPDEKLTAVIDGLLRVGFTDIILINDGSKPEHLHYFEAAAQHPEITLLHHPENRGKGAALKTAFTYVLDNRPDSLGVVTVDGDNQHHC